MARVVALTSDPHLSYLRVFAHLLNKYWQPNPEVLVGGFTPPAFSLPGNFTFHSIGPASDYPVGHWSDGLLKLLRDVPDKHLILLLEDYWLKRAVDVDALRLLESYLWLHSNVLRIDLTTDRLYAAGARDWESLGRLDLIITPNTALYQISLQAGLWNKRLLESLLLPGETPWQFEMDGSNRFAESGDGLVVLGTRQAPLRYLIGVRAGVMSLDGSWQAPPMRLCPADEDEVSRLLQAVAG